MRMERAMLFVKDLAGMTAFYRDVIGFRPIDETARDDWIEFDAGGGTPFALHAIPAHIANTISISSPPVARESQNCKLIFAADDPDRERARLEAAGVTILRRPWGGWDAVDPEGNVFGIRAAAS
jgi:catechol 2,3-dioxygenase-like lactoylglutathione lyase family enzyme